MARSAERRCVVAVLLVLAASACARQSGRVAVTPVVDTVDIEASILLIGDAGAVRPVDDVVLRALTDEVQRVPARTLVIFLGDNVYPAGIPSDAGPARRRAESRLLAQAASARSAHEIIFVPGNHDWTGAGVAGWAGVRRQATLLRETTDATMVPAAGCPGPEVRDVGSAVRLVFLDTEWWLRGSPAPRTIDDCPQTTPVDVVAAVQRALRDADGRHVLLVGHHAPVSAGPHAGHFSWRDQLFPLRGIHRWLWLPLPIVGSIGPLFRRLGLSAQDQSSARYKHLIVSLRSAVGDRQPLAFVAGHEHQLGVFSGAAVGATLALVSGAGSMEQVTAVGRAPNARFSSASAGFLRLDVVRGPPGAPPTLRLRVIGVDRAGRARDRFTMPLN